MSELIEELAAQGLNPGCTCWECEKMLAAARVALESLPCTCPPKSDRIGRRFFPCLRCQRLAELDPRS